MSQKASLNPRISLFLMPSYSILSREQILNRESLGIIFAFSLSLSLAGSASPVISPDLSALVVNTGDPVLLHCSGESEVAWNSKKNTFSNHTISTLSIPEATYRNTGTYSCGYVNSSDKGTAAIHLFVRGNPASLFPHPLAEQPPSREHSHCTGPFCCAVPVCVLGEQCRLLVGQCLSHNHLSPHKMGPMAKALG